MLNYSKGNSEDNEFINDQAILTNWQRGIGRSRPNPYKGLSAFLMTMSI